MATDGLPMCVEKGGGGAQKFIGASYNSSLRVEGARYCIIFTIFLSALHKRSRYYVTATAGSRSDRLVRVLI